MVAGDSGWVGNARMAAIDHLHAEEPPVLGRHPRALCAHVARMLVRVRNCTCLFVKVFRMQLRQHMTAKKVSSKVEL